MSFTAQLAPANTDNMETYQTQNQYYTGKPENVIVSSNSSDVTSPTSISDDVESITGRPGNHNSWNTPPTPTMNLEQEMADLEFYSHCISTLQNGGSRDDLIQSLPQAMQNWNNPTQATRQYPQFGMYPPIQPNGEPFTSIDFNMDPKLARRRAQNRASQRAYRARKERSLEESQARVQELERRIMELADGDSNESKRARLEEKVNTLEAKNASLLLVNQKLKQHLGELLKLEADYKVF